MQKIIALFRKDYWGSIALMRKLFRYAEKK